MNRIIQILVLLPAILLAVDIDTIPDWHPGLEIQTPEALEKGFYCKHGTLDSIPLYWRARGWLQGGDIPGEVQDSARPTAWWPVNSRSFTEGKEYEWKGWNSDCPKYELKHDVQTQKVVAKEVGSWGDQIDKKGVGAYIPTWRDGAEGAYSIIVEQLGMTNYEGHVEPAVEVGLEYPHINMGFATKVDVMSDEEWAQARQLVLQGHEILNGSYDYNPVYNQWFFFFHGDTISPDNPHIPRQIRGLVVDSTISGNELSYDVKYVDYPDGDPAKAESLSYREAYDVWEYSEDPNPDTENNIYKNRGKIKAVHNGFDESQMKNVLMLKVRGNRAWTENSYRANVEFADSLINENIYYHHEVLNQAPYVPEGFTASSYSFPFNICASDDISYIKEAGYVGGTKGGINWGFPTPGDFYDPYRINYDVANILDDMGTITFPDNPIMKLGIQEMVDNIVKSKGYMIRTINGCVDHDGWECNCPKPHPMWPGLIHKTLLAKHFKYLDELITQNKLYVAPPTEIVKYRMTADAASNAKVTERGGLAYELSVDGGDVLPEYQDEISVIVVLNNGRDELNSRYEDDSKRAPRYQPRKMSDDGKVWSISINPFEGKLIFGPSTSVLETKFENKNHVVYANNKIQLRLPKGAYQGVLNSLNGRKILAQKIQTQREGGMHSFSLSGVSTGVYLFSVTGDKGSVLSQKVVIQ